MLATGVAFLIMVFAASPFTVPSSACRIGGFNRRVQEHVVSGDLVSPLGAQIPATRDAGSTGLPNTPPADFCPASPPFGEVRSMTMISSQAACGAVARVAHGRGVAPDHGRQRPPACLPSVLRL
jgi:hypothetical protein